jgi:ATP-dependent DNA helicase DinG
MLDALETGERREEFVDWFEIEREDGRDVDVGLWRHWIDPTIPLVGRSAGAGAWRADHLGHVARCGIRRRRLAIGRSAHRRGPSAGAAAPRQLRLAVRYARAGAHLHRARCRAPRSRRARGRLSRIVSGRGGGALGLFTAVRALRAVEERIAAPLADAGLTLYAQHVDRLDTGALVDLFRAEENACLLGTDALRDGVDVPGRSLRLVVFDKVPWPKPTILHKARRARFGKSYDDLLTRLRLKQAFGRLIRSQTDKGCFVILESATPSRLLSAFPPERPVKRCGLAERLRNIRASCNLNAVGI